MNAAILTDVFVGEAWEFRDLKGNLIGGAEVYLNDLIKNVLLDIFDKVDIFQFEGKKEFREEKVNVRKIKDYKEINLKDYKVILFNNALLTKKVREAARGMYNFKARPRFIGIHHGMVIRPFLFKVETLKYLFLTRKNFLKLLFLLAKWEPSRLLQKCKLNYYSKFYDKIISVDKDSLRHLVWAERGKWQVVLNAVNLKDFSFSEEDYKEKIEIVVPRNLRFERGMHLIPEIAQKIKEKTKKSFFFKIVGTGELRDFIEKEIKRRKLEKQVVIFGHKSHEEMPKVYQEANIVLIPTLHDEGTSISALEAMASGRAVVMTNIGGLNDIGENQVSKLSCRCNSSAITSCLLELIENNALRKRVAQAGLETIKQNHNLDDWAKKWKLIIKNILK